MFSRFFLFSLCAIFLLTSKRVDAQCGGQIMEPGFAFISSSRGCAPFTVQIETLYLNSTPDTKYYVDWGDGSAQEVFTQTNASGVIISHPYPNSPIDCGYNVVIDAENSCNPLGSVVRITTQVIVWTNDIIAVNPAVHRVCQGYASTLQFTDNSDWNCYPRDTRENGEPRWIQWIYGTGSSAIRIPGIQVDGIAPGFYPYTNPAPNTNPIYPVTTPGQVSLGIDVPITTPADIGREFEITLKNWNQCNAYDNVLTDANPFNPVNGDLVNGDNSPQLTTARIVIVPSPEPAFVTRLGNSTGPIKSIFCIDEDIFFDNQTPAIAGANFRYTWEFYNNSAGTGVPLSTSNQSKPTFAYNQAGQKLIRLRVRDDNAAGNCEATAEFMVNISPSVTAQIQVTDLLGNAIAPNFCQEPNGAPSTFDARFIDASMGTPNANTGWRWEFYDENENLIMEAPNGGGYSSSTLGPFDRTFTNKGIYRIRLSVRDNVTLCESTDEVLIKILEKPLPAFSYNRVCVGEAVTFSDMSTLNPTMGEQIVSWEWDMNYDGATFTPEPSLSNKQNFDYVFTSGGTHQVALQVAANLGECEAVLIKPVVVDPNPIAVFTPDVVAGCSVLEVNFTNGSIDGQPVAIEKYIWEIDEDDGQGFQADSTQRPSDGSVGPLFTRSFKNTSNTNKDFRIRLRVVNINGCESLSAPVTITVFPGPPSGFSTVNYSPFEDNCSPRQINFTVDAITKSYNPSNYTWTVSDATGVLDQISTGTTPSFSYNFVNTTQSVKNFNITLRSTLPSDCYGDSIQIVRISPIPQSGFGVDTLEYSCEYMTLRFSATQKGLNNYVWDLAINNVPLFSGSTEEDYLVYNFSLLNGATQNVAVGLTTYNLLNCASPRTQKVFVIPPSDNVSAEFDVTPLVQTLPSRTVSITHTTNSGPYNYLWDFGDGQTSTDPNVTSHTYEGYGRYTIRLTVSLKECSQERIKTITINPIPPVIDFTYGPGEGCVPLVVEFTNKSLYADPGTYMWDFGDGETSTEVNPVHTYTSAGQYSVTLSASNATGETVYTIKENIIEGYVSPSALFAIKPAVITLPGGKLYTNNMSFGASAYQWDFGDGETSTEYEPFHEYREEGIYNIQLVAINSNGCSDTTLINSAVRVQNNGQLLIPNAFSPSISGPGSIGGQNDVFMPVISRAREFEMYVFNRWGEMLFQTKDQSMGWDGYYKGKLCAQDVYIYKIVVTFEDGNTLTRVGDINLMR